MRKTILVVDDFEDIREFMCETLQGRGYNTLSAANGTEAYRLLTEHAATVSLVLMDYTMPDGSGYDLLLRIRTNHMMAGVAVVFLTTESSPEKMEAARRAGLSGWIRKPYRAEAFFGQIKNALEGGIFRTHP